MTEQQACTLCGAGGHTAAQCKWGETAKLVFVNGKPAKCGCHVEHSSGGGEYSDVIYVSPCRQHSGRALELVAENRIALTPEYEGQWHADLYLDHERPLATAEAETPMAAILEAINAERAQPEQDQKPDPRGEFRQHLKQCAAEVSTWPAHKRNALGELPGQADGAQGELAALAWLESKLNDMPAWFGGEDHTRTSGWMRDQFILLIQEARAALAQPSPAPELWAVHAQGPDDLYAAFSREDAEKHAAALNSLPMPEGIEVGAVVAPSPWPAVEHWKYLAEQERDHNADQARVAELERQKPVGYGNADELDGMLKDRAATISPNKNGHFGTPLYAEPVAQAGQVPEGWRIEQTGERIVVQQLQSGAGYAAAREGESGIAESVLFLLAADLIAAAPAQGGE